LGEISSPMLLQTLRRVEARGVRETVHSISQACGPVFRYGVATGRCERNPAGDLRGALRPVLVKHMAAIVEPDEFAALLAAIADYQGSLTTRDLQPLTGHGKYVFPSLQGQGRCMSENTVNVALRRLGFDKDVHGAHGFRSNARTLIVERLDLAPDVVEAQLAHMKSGPLGGAYDRAEFLQ
jgi:integrase